MNDLDKNKRFQLQNAEARPNECVGIAIADVLGNHYEQLLDSDFSEAAAFHLLGQGGSDGGTDLKAAMLGACVYGALPETDDHSDPIQTSEAKETDWASYTQQQIELAAHFAPNGIIPLYTYDQITEYMQRYQMGVPLQVKWFADWRHVPVGSQLPTPTVTGAYTNHVVATYQPSALGLTIKASDVPGYHYLPRSIFETAGVVECCYGFSFDAYKFLTLVSAILYTKNWALIGQLNNGKMRSV